MHNPKIRTTLILGMASSAAGTIVRRLTTDRQQQRCVGCMAIVQQVGVHGQEGGGVRRAQLSGGSNIQRGALPHWLFGLK